MPNDADAAEAFGILADPTRIAILRTFAEALDQTELDSAGPMMPTLSFSEVYDRIDVDSTSQLSYHLEKLDGTFLRHTNQGWRFTITGMTMVRFVLSESYAGSVAFDPVDIEGHCPHCDAASLRVVVEDHVLFRKCSDCGRRMGGVAVTPAQVRNRDWESLLASAKTRMVSHFRQFREDVCPECGGTVEIEFRNVPDAAGHFGLVAVGRCEQCRRSVNAPPSMWVSNHSASVAFHWEHGVDVRSFGLREVIERLASGDWRTDRVESDEYTVAYQVENAELRLTIDDDLSVLSAERVRRNSMAES